jgi:hypothetical protein
VSGLEGPGEQADARSRLPRLASSQRARLCTPCSRLLPPNPLIPPCISPDSAVYTRMTLPWTLGSSVPLATWI